MEAKEVKNLRDMVGWWASEKYDGHKGRWDGTRMWSRNKEEPKQCHPPANWLKHLPDACLEGELYIEGGTHYSMGKLGWGRNTSMDLDFWKDVKYKIYDLPDSKEPIEQRIKEMKRICKDNSLLECVEQVQYKTVEEIKEAFKKFMAKDNGEGMVFKKRGSVYTPGRTGVMLKHRMYEDAEGRVVSCDGTTMVLKKLDGNGTVKVKTPVILDAGTLVNYQVREKAKGKIYMYAGVRDEATMYSF
jgi:DNA ligase 1